MSLAVAWTNDARETFKSTITQIETKWGFDSAQKFVRDANKVIDTITMQPYLFKSAHSQNIRKALISKQTSMFYEVHTAHITILFFWDNRQEPFL